MRLTGVPPGDDRSFLLQRVQPAMSGLMDGSLSTLAPIFAVVLATHHPLTAFFTGLATALGAGVSMAFSEGLSDTGEETGRGRPLPSPAAAPSQAVSSIACPS
jgi:erythrin-vacuolar iron transport family protein